MSAIFNLKFLIRDLRRGRLARLVAVAFTELRSSLQYSLRWQTGTGRGRMWRDTATSSTILLLLLLLLVLYNVYTRPSKVDNTRHARQRVRCDSRFEAVFQPFTLHDAHDAYIDNAKKTRNIIDHFHKSIFSQIADESIGLWKSRTSCMEVKTYTYI